MAIAPEPRPRRLLIVDDMLELAALLRRLAREVGGPSLDVVVEARGDRALARLESERFDAVMSDLRLPGADGLEVLAAARARMPDSRRILMTGYSTMEMDAARFDRAQPDLVLHKPFAGIRLEVLIADALGVARQGATVNSSEKSLAGAECVRNPSETRSASRA